MIGPVLFQLLLFNVCIAFIPGNVACSKLPTLVRGAHRRHSMLQEVELDSAEIVAEITRNNGSYTTETVRNLINGRGVSLHTLSPRKLEGYCKSVFLPVGFPTTTPPEYAAFQKWNLIQDLCSYLRGIMSTGALLSGMGVGRAEATALQATIQWMYRDGAGMLGSLFFTSLSSHNFGQNLKAWRLFADFINNVGITLDMIAPYFRKQFLYIACTAAVCKALCGVAAGATGAAIAEHWGEQHGNIADVLAKNGAQHTMVSMLGLLVTVPFATFSARSPALACAGYTLLTAIHMFANWRAMRVLALRTLNPTRGKVLLRELLLSRGVQLLLLKNYTGLPKELETAKIQIDVLAVSSVARQESIFEFRFPAKENILPSSREGIDNMVDNVKLWASPSELASIVGNEQIISAAEKYQHCNYFLIRAPSTCTVYVCFRRGASGPDQMQAWLEACLLQLTGSTEQARQLSDTIAQPFVAALRARGWKVDLPLLQPRGAHAYSLL